MKSSLKNHNAEALRRSDSAHHQHPFTDSAALEREGGTRIVVRGDGCTITDTEGNRLLDGMAGLWCVAVGYGREELARVAYEQMQVLPYYNSFFKSTVAPAIELADRLAGLLPERINTIFFNNSGSEANDTALRLVRHYWTLRGKPDKKTIISRINAYHGSTVAGASLGGMAFMHAQGDLPIPGIEHVAQPYWFGEGRGETPEAFGRRIAREVEQKILDLGPDKVAAFIGEPVQGAGGVIIPPDSYWPEINRICRAHDVLLICDEVICGFGRTGNWFGFETFGIEPDLVPMAKGLSSGYLPISALGISDGIMAVLREAGSEFAHGYTYSGHPVAAAVALRNIEIIDREGLVGKVRDRTGPYLAQALASLDDHPLVGETRSVGLLGAIELVRDKESGARFDPSGRAGEICRDHCTANGLVMRACGDTMVCAPPLIIEPGEIDQMVSIARAALDLTLADLTG